MGNPLFWLKILPGEKSRQICELCVSNDIINQSWFTSVVWWRRIASKNKYSININQYSSNASVATCLWSLRIEPIIATVYIVAKRRQWRRRGQYSE